MGSRTLDILHCNVVTQSTTVPRAPILMRLINSEARCRTMDFSLGYVNLVRNLCEGDDHLIGNCTSQRTTFASDYSRNSYIPEYWIPEYFLSQERFLFHFHSLLAVLCISKVDSILGYLVSERHANRSGDSGVQRTRQWDISVSDPSSIIRWFTYGELRKHPYGAVP
jgi:hypothetical protein